MNSYTESEFYDNLSEWPEPINRGIHMANRTHWIAKEHTSHEEDEKMQIASDFEFSSSGKLPRISHYPAYMRINLDTEDKRGGGSNINDIVPRREYASHQLQSHAPINFSGYDKHESFGSSGGHSKFDLIAAHAASVSRFIPQNDSTPRLTGGRSTSIPFQASASSSMESQDYPYLPTFIENKTYSIPPGVSTSTAWTAPSSSILPTSFLKRSWMLENPKQRRQRLINGYQGIGYGRVAQARAKNVPDKENCSLWITEIPLTVQYSDVFAAINCGAVFALVLNPPEPTKGLYFQAAKLVFCKPESAAYFVARVRAGIFRLHGKILTIRYNRASEERYIGNSTRVLLVKGPHYLMNFPTFDRLFRSICAFNWDCVQTIEIGPTHTTMEFRFARINGQALMCFQGIIRSNISHQVEVRYGADPCDQLDLSALQPL